MSNRSRSVSVSVSVLGDSASTLFGYSHPSDAVFYTAAKHYETGVYSLSDTWWGQVIDTLGGRLLVNNSFSGSTACLDPRNGLPLTVAPMRVPRNWVQTGKYRM